MSEQSQSSNITRGKSDTNKKKWKWSECSLDSDSDSCDLDSSTHPLTQGCPEPQGDERNDNASKPIIIARRVRVSNNHNIAWTIFIIIIIIIILIVIYIVYISYSAYSNPKLTYHDKLRLGYY